MSLSLVTDGKSMLFSPYDVHGVTFKNRIIMSPMCMHSTDETGFVRDFHKVHYGCRALGNVGLILTETLAIQPNGRLASTDLGAWNDNQIPGLKELVNVVHDFGAKIGAQIGHSGRKADLSDLPGLRMIAPSPLAAKDDMPVPEEITKEEIKEVIESFRSTAKRCREAGFDVIEIHCAHGYLLNEFLSPLSNIRTDEYGGNIDNRYRIVSEVIDAVRTEWDGPLFARVSTTDYAQGGVTPEMISYYAKKMKLQGVDLLDCSSGGIAPVPVVSYPNYQVPAAEFIRKDAQIPTAAVGMITTGAQAEEILRNNRSDMIVLGRALIRNPFWAREAALQLGVEFETPVQYTKYGASWF